MKYTVVLIPNSAHTKGNNIKYQLRGSFASEDVRGYEVYFGHFKRSITQLLLCDQKHHVWVLVFLVSLNKRNTLGTKLNMLNRLGDFFSVCNKTASPTATLFK